MKALRRFHKYYMLLPDLTSPVLRNFKKTLSILMYSSSLRSLVSICFLLVGKNFIAVSLKCLCPLLHVLILSSAVVLLLSVPAVRVLNILSER